ncbi:Enhancer of polycomb-like transcription factor protein [Abeliophyllum distichum]|uniref:Enhancer of polycomb-like protein n=1 Tax=Abeliophyllum distichum TaxID=126358 RepID=A0ABD1P5P6_9LAMI
MPSVGMRRSTRVFGTRVLRSGRRVWRGPVDGGKYKRTINGDDECIELVDNSGGGRGDAGSPCKGSTRGENENENDLTIEMVTESRIETREGEGTVEATNEDRMYGSVYSRKRKRMESESTGISEDMRFGKKFARKKRSKKLETCGELRVSDNRCRELAVVAAEPSGDSGHWIACFLNSVLRYLWRVKFGLQWLSVFVFSEPIFHAFSLRGILFLKDPTLKKPGFCIISESRSLMPVFAVDYSAVPFSFMHLHSSMYIRSAHLACVLVLHHFGANGKVEKVTDYDKEHSFDSPTGRDQSGCTMVTSEIDDCRRRELSRSTVGFSKSSVRNNQLRTGRGIQKRRTSPRRRRGRPPSVFRTLRARGRHDGFQSSIMPTGHLLHSSIKESSTLNIKTLKSAMVGLIQDIDANSCSANILVVESNKCYREEGAIITLEVSASKHWFLAVKKDGIERYNLTAQKVMRPSSFNRVTRATIWSGDSNWKLEFPCKQDWLIFKELYKKCSDHNIQGTATSVIPVPGVREVLVPPYTDNIPYVRPDSYITVKDDELARALDKRTANYDMDSEDEEWLKKFNTEFNVEKELHQLVIPEKFELIIDALERGFHSNADDRSDEKVADSLPMDLERKEVVESVHNYWIQKRRRKHSALVRIFQLYQPRRTQVIPKSVLRKKRSFKRHGSQAGRGKQPPFLQDMAEEHALEQQNNFYKVQEATAAANRSEGFAILKRQRAQMLFENADMATYKAMMALRIAESAQNSESQSDITPLFLH